MLDDQVGHEGHPLCLGVCIKHKAALPRRSGTYVEIEDVLVALHNWHMGALLAGTDEVIRHSIAAQSIDKCRSQCTAKGTLS